MSWLSGLARVDEARVFRYLPNGRLVHFAEREKGVLKLLLRQGVKHVALVFRTVLAAKQPVPAGLGVARYRSVVAGRDIVETEQQRALYQFVEFDVPVAVDAGVRRPFPRDTS